MIDWSVRYRFSARKKYRGLTDETQILPEPTTEKALKRHLRLDHNHHFSSGWPLRSHHFAEHLDSHTTESYSDPFNRTARYSINDHVHELAPLDIPRGEGWDVAGYITRKRARFAEKKERRQKAKEFKATRDRLGMPYLKEEVYNLAQESGVKDSELQEAYNVGLSPTYYTRIRASGIDVNNQPITHQQALEGTFIHERNGEGGYGRWGSYYLRNLREGVGLTAKNNRLTYWGTPESERGSLTLRYHGMTHDEVVHRYARLKGYRNAQDFRENAIVWLRPYGGPNTTCENANCDQDHEAHNIIFGVPGKCKF